MIFFVCGLSKVGKSNLINSAINKQFGWFRHAAAGEILRSLGRPTVDIRASEVVDNQSVLTGAIISRIEASPGDWLIDGHLLIETVDGPQLVAEGLISSIPIDHILLVEASPTTVLERRKSTTIQLSSEIEARDLMELERIQAQRLARQRFVSLSRVDAKNMSAFCSEIEQALKRAHSV